MTEDRTTEIKAPYAEAAAQIAATVAKKQKAYGDSFGKSGDVMRILYPSGISHEQIDDALCVVRILDKLFRIATDKDALGESPYGDIVGYGLLGLVRDRRARILKGEPEPDWDNAESFYKE